MSKPKETKSTFETLISGNKAAITDVEAAKSDIARIADDAEKDFWKSFDAVTTHVAYSLDPATLKKYSDAAVTVNFIDSYHADLADSAAAHADHDKLKPTLDTPDVRRQKLEAIDAEKAPFEAIMAEARNEIAAFRQKFKPLYDFNEKADQKNFYYIHENSAEWFRQTKKDHAVRFFLAMALSRHFRRAVKLTRKIEKDIMPLPEAAAELETYKKKGREAEAEAKRIAAKKDIVNQPFKDLAALEVRFLTEDGAKEKLKKRMQENLKSDNALNRAGKTVGLETIGDVIMMRAKVQALRDLAQSLAAFKGGFDDMNEKMSKHLPALKEAIGYGRTDSLDIGLDDIKSTCETSQTKAAQAAKQARAMADMILKSRGAPQQDLIAALDPLQAYRQNFILSILKNNIADPAFVNTALDVNHITAVDAGVDGTIAKLSLKVPALTFDDDEFDGIDEDPSPPRSSSSSFTIGSSGTSFGGFSSGGSSGGGFSGFGGGSFGGGGASGSW